MTVSGTRVVDAHVRVGEGREVSLPVRTLLASMDALGIDAALISPPERCVAYANAEGNALVTGAAAASGGRLLAYAVANPWRGTEAVAELERARDAGAVALAVDPVLQGFDLHDGLLDPLLERAAAWRWPVYVRTGTPPTALPLPLASLARRHPGVTFLMGRSGATDFWIDAVPALRHAPNLLADTSYAPWDTVLSGFAADPAVGPSRVVFSTDAPYTIPESELKRVLDWPLSRTDRASVLGATLLSHLP
ncbi:MAG TPA: amidohydrolase family protein [Streptosporangiaceae bacterium]|jgi:predicted TIM-barrel fold metal-dependent hydrolase